MFVSLRVTELLLFLKRNLVCLRSRCIVGKTSPSANNRVTWISAWRTGWRTRTTSPLACQHSHQLRKVHIQKENILRTIRLSNFSAVEAYLPGLLDSFRPDLVLYDAGVDPHCEDELGRLRLTDHGEAAMCEQLPQFTDHIQPAFIKKIFSTPGLFQRDLYVLKTVVSRGVPVATVIGGGYSRDIDKLAVRHSIVHRAATQVWKNNIWLIWV